MVVIVIVIVIVVVMMTMMMNVLGILEALILYPRDRDLARGWLRVEKKNRDP